MKDVQQLPLVLVQTLHLHIENGSGVHIDAVVFFDIFRQPKLVLVLDIHELLLAFLVVRVYFQLLYMGQVGDPFVTDLISHPLSQQGVAVQQEAALGDTVGLIVELLRHHLVEVF